MLFPLRAVQVPGPQLAAEFKVVPTQRRDTGKGAAGRKLWGGDGDSEGPQAGSRGFSYSFGRTAKSPMVHFGWAGGP